MVLPLLRLFSLKVLFPSFINTVLMVCFGLVTKPNWLGLGKHQGSSSNCIPPKELEMTTGLLKITPGFVTTETAGDGQLSCDK